MFKKKEILAIVSTVTREGQSYANYVAGKPLLAWSLDALSASRSVDRVVVFADDSEIRGITDQHGLEVVQKPTEFISDVNFTDLSPLQVVYYLRELENYCPYTLVFVNCTYPLLNSSDLDGAIETFFDEDADSVVSVTSFQNFLWQEETDGSVSRVNHDKARRQHREVQETQYKETDGICVMDREGFEESEHWPFGRVVPYEVPRERSIKVDGPVDTKIAEELLREAKIGEKANQLPDRIEALVLDFDGVFTDNKVQVRQDRTEMVTCHRGDGWGISELREKGLPIWVLSTEKNPVVQARCDKLNLPCMYGAEDKEALLEDWLANRDIDPGHVVFLGNDVNDQECIRLAGCGAVVADAHPAVKPSANLILSTDGGQGAVRELIDLILRNNI